MLSRIGASNVATTERVPTIKELTRPPPNRDAVNNPDNTRRLFASRSSDLPMLSNTAYSPHFTVDRCHERWVRSRRLTLL